MEDLKSNLRRGRIKEVRWLQTVRDGKRSDSEGIVIVFDDEIIPTKVMLVCCERIHSKTSKIS